VARRLRLRYTTTLGFEVTHLAEEAERKWFRTILTAEELTRPLTPAEQRSVLQRLTEVDANDPRAYMLLGQAYLAAKNPNPARDAFKASFNLQIEGGYVRRKEAKKIEFIAFKLGERSTFIKSGSFNSS